MAWKDLRMFDMRNMQPGSNQEDLRAEWYEVERKTTKQSLMNAWRTLSDEDFVRSELLQRVTYHTIPTQYLGRSMKIFACSALATSRTRLH